LHWWYIQLSDAQHLECDDNDKQAVDMLPRLNSRLEFRNGATLKMQRATD